MRCVTKYDKPIQIQKVTGTTKDAHGHIDKTSDANWGEHEGGYASVQSKGGREFWKVDQVQADVSHVWTVQYTSKMAASTPDMRLKSEGVIYEILSVIDIDLAHREVQIQTRRAV